MTFTSDMQASASVECNKEHHEATVPTLHIEETPCVMIPAVTAPAVTVRLWQPRTMHAWLT